MKKEQSSEESEVLFLVSPNFGLLDSWLPILFELKRRSPDLKLTAVFPKSQTVLEVNPAEITAHLGESIFNSVIVRSRAGFWISSTSFKEAKERATSYRFLDLILGKIRTALHFSPKKFKKGGNVKAICFDLFAKTKKECRAILDQFPNTPRFSILHGIAIADFAISGGDYDKASRTYPVKAYVYSKNEIQAYKENYGLTEDEIKVVGVPRHNPGWIEEIMKRVVSDVPKSWDRYIFLISRPAIENFFPREKKREVLQEIKKLAREDLHARVVVKVHPTEVSKSDGLYEEVFGKERYGDDWVYSSAHPFLLGKGSIFAISFYSGVCIDMLAIGVPTIERTVIREDSNRRMGFVMDFKKRGLVLGAKDYGELKHHALRIMSDRTRVIEEMKAHYAEYFAFQGNPIETITDDICKVLE